MEDSESASAFMPTNVTLVIALPSALTAVALFRQNSVKNSRAFGPATTRLPKGILWRRCFPYLYRWPGEPLHLATHFPLTISVAFRITIVVSGIDAFLIFSLEKKYLILLYLLEGYSSLHGFNLI
jgi:hypothetical protein